MGSRAQLTQERSRIRRDELLTAAIALITGAAFRRQSELYPDEIEPRLLAGAIRGLVSAHVTGPHGVDRALSILCPSPT